MERKNRRLCLLLLLACALVLPACGENQLPPEPEEGVLVYAALNPIDEELTRSVEKFNEMHPDAQIEIRDYSDEGGPQRLLTELVLGRVPDIMEMQRLGTQHYYSSIPVEAEALWSGTPLDGEFTDPMFWMPYRQMAQKGYLEDLWPYIENDPDLGRESVLEAPLKAAEVNGGLYMLFQQVSVSTLMGRENTWGEDRYGITLEEILETFSAMPEDSTILRYETTRSDVFFRLLSPTLDQFIDWETGECSFDSQGFRDMIDFLNAFPTEFDSSLTLFKLSVENGWRLLDGRNLLEPVNIGKLCDLTAYRGKFFEPFSFVGYPTVDGSFGSCFILHGNKLAMSSTCQNKQAAWEYIRQLIQRKYRSLEYAQKECHANHLRLQINYKDYYAQVRSDLERFAVSGFGWRVTQYFSDGPEFPFERPTQEDAERLDNIINKTTRIYWPNDDLANIIWESCGPYFAGDKSLDETIQMIQNRVRLYVNEQT